MNRRKTKRNNLIKFIGIRLKNNEFETNNKIKKYLFSMK
jgi:hypothetical protein